MSSSYIILLIHDRSYVFGSGSVFVCTMGNLFTVSEKLSIYIEGITSGWHTGALAYKWIEQLLHKETKQCALGCYILIWTHLSLPPSPPPPLSLSLSLSLCRVSWILESKTGIGTLILVFAKQAPNWLSTYETYLGSITDGSIEVLRLKLDLKHFGVLLMYRKMYI